MASRSIPPPVEAAPEPPPLWRYTGTYTRMYTSVPVTVEPGDVLEWPTVPAEDGMWEPAEAGTEPTVVPDNAHPNAARIWSPDELAHGWGADGGHAALREDWPTDPTTEPEPEPGPADSSDSEVTGDA